MASFATPADLAAYANTLVDTPRMQALLDLASGIIRRYANQTISEVLGDSVEFGPQNHVTLFLPEVPVLNVTSVTVGLVAVTDIDWYRGGQVIGAEVWEDGAIVVYDHGWASTTDTFAAVKSVCLEMAAAAFTTNEHGSSEVMGATIMESAGYAPRLYLTADNKELLHDLGPVPVG